MKKNEAQRRAAVAWTFTTILFLTLLVSVMATVGCGSGNSGDAELDRVPSIPPSTRGAEGAVVTAPKDR